MTARRARPHEREVALALREITRQHGCEGRIVAACADGTSLDASTAADTLRRIGTKLVAGDDGSRRAEFHTAAAVRAPVGRGLDRHPLRMPLLTAAVTEYEPHEPPHRESIPLRTVGNFFTSIARTPPAASFAATTRPEGLGLGTVVPVGPPRSDRPTRRGVGVLADERGRSHGHESPCRHEIGQLARGMFVGAIAVEHDHHGRRTVAPHGIQPPQGKSGAACPP